jgi:hypothetical protein
LLGDGEVDVINDLLNMEKQGENMSNVCPICQHQRYTCFESKILNKYDIDYFYCENCGLLQTEKPFWLDEAYSYAIAKTDTGLLARNLYISKVLSNIIFTLFDKNGKYVDVAGGYGVLTRLMRDVGFDFYWRDIYCQNIFAQEFEAGQTSHAFIAATAFEVIEHVYNPVEFIQQCFTENRTSTLLFSTELFINEPPKISNWNYYALETGQHISFYQYKTLVYISKLLALSIYSVSNIYILTIENIRPSKINFLNNRKLINLFNYYVRKQMKPKTLSDYSSLKEKLVLTNRGSIE